ncbi:MAG: Exonuclease RNase and polymerase [Frankiales bacterium]|nr:Exonuclease RNase and polymerase [Frankiales bacterium]
MTGLELSSDVLIEIAVLVTDSELNVIDDEGLDIVIAASDETMAGMVPLVHQMHAGSGLTEAVLASTVTLADAEQQVLAYIKRFVPEPRKAPLCGNSIATDRSFIARDMPELDGWLHYRMVDVSSVKELARRWYPRAYYASPAKSGGHRALADIRESIDELRYYRAAIFVPQPGPTTEECQALATAILGAAASAIPEGPGSADVPISELPREH